MSSYAAYANNPVLDPFLISGVDVRCAGITTEVYLIPYPSIALPLLTLIHY